MRPGERIREDNRDQVRSGPARSNAVHWRFQLLNSSRARSFLLVGEVLRRIGRSRHMEANAP
jgi:hypothetical protein